MKKTFIIVDGHALLHRAWNALPPLNAPDGRLIHGAYGFTTILLNALKSFAPTNVAVTFDLEGPTFRHEEYEDYKGTREEKPDELYEQIEYIEKILEAMDIPVYVAEGFEADDVIGTLTRLAKDEKGVETVVVTGDLDTLQLVDSRTKVFTMRRGMSDTVTYDEAAVRERYSLDPSQLVDYKALRGDSSDNIPGVKGIGDKTASELVGKFGSLKGLYDAIDDGSDELKSSVREKLLAGRADAEKAYGLCTIKRDVDLDFSFADTGYESPTREQMSEVFAEYGFMKLLSRIPSGSDTEAPSEATAVSSGTLVETAGSVEDLEKFISGASEFAFLSVCPAGGSPVSISPDAVLFCAEGRVLSIGSELLKSSASQLGKFFAAAERIVCHDLKRELHVFANVGISLEGKFSDIMISSYLLHSGQRKSAILPLLKSALGEVLEQEEEEDEISFVARQLKFFSAANAELEKDLKKKSLVSLRDDIELPLSRVLARMERLGILVDEKHFKDAGKKLAERIKELTAEIHGYAGHAFNVNSPAQLKVVLFDELEISSEGMKKTAKNKSLSTAASELEKIMDQHDIIPAVLKYREAAKLQSTYVLALPELIDPSTHRIHAEFNQTVAATGRLSSSNPNLQNIPTAETEYGKMVRDGFIAKEGCTLLACDYSQFELRIAAHIANEKSMIEAFRRGDDIHRATAITMFGEEEADSRRRVAKAINFGILYGMGPNKLSDSAGISFMEARDFIAKYFDKHPGISKYLDRIRKEVEKDEFVETLLGRKLFFKNVKFMNPRERSEVERQAINMPIQGSQADMVKIAMLGVDKLISEKYSGKASLNVQIHDELVFEVQKDVLDSFMADIKEVMESVYELKVPLVVNCSVGDRWGSMKKLD